MKVKAVLSAFLFLILLMPWLAAAEDARLPYHEIYSMQKVQLDLSRTYTNLALVLQMRSTQTNVSGSDIKATINSKSGSIPVSVSEDGVFIVPMRDDLLAEDPWIQVNQPKGTMQLNWHAGLAPSVARQLTKGFHYTPLMKAVQQCDNVQEAMRQFFPTAPRLTAVGLRLTFRTTAAEPAVFIHSKSGDRKLPANTLRELIIPVDEDLLQEDPDMIVTEPPLAVEIVTKKTEGP
jgi:hypothetical protein